MNDWKQLLTSVVSLSGQKTKLRAEVRGTAEVVSRPSYRHVISRLGKGNLGEPCRQSELPTAGCGRGGGATTRRYPRHKPPAIKKKHGQPQRLGSFHMPKPGLTVKPGCQVRQGFDRQSRVDKGLVSHGAPSMRLWPSSNLIWSTHSIHSSSSRRTTYKMSMVAVMLHRLMPSRWSI